MATYMTDALGNVTADKDAVVLPKPDGGPENAALRNSSGMVLVKAKQTFRVVVELDDGSRHVMASGAGNPTKADLFTGVRVKVRAIQDMALPAPDIDEKVG